MKKETKDFLKKIPGMQPAVRSVKNGLMDIHAISNFFSEKAIHRGNGPIRVGFLCQYLPAWTKTQDIYLKMKADPRFDPYVLCIPTNVSTGAGAFSSRDNEAYAYCIANGFPEAINTVIGENSWLDLKSLNLEYIFYPRPYDVLLPQDYYSDKVSKYSKICFIMYGISLSQEGHRLMQKSFMSNVYLYFAETEEAKEYNIQLNRLLHYLGMRKTLCCGYPMMDHILKYRDTPSDAWQFSHNPFRVLWTPRWTSNITLGGSNFQRYYPVLLNLAKEHPDIDVLHRPHPMTFDHFIQTGKMTASEIEEYKALCHSMPNSQLDEAPNYEATLWNTTIFVTDVTSLLPEFFVTGHPILFCETEGKLPYTDFSRRMLDCCYIINNADELIRTTLMLKNGTDPLREKRHALKENLIHFWSTNDNNNILDALLR